MILPVLVFLVNCEFRYHYRPFKPGESFLLKLYVSPEIPNWQNAFQLRLPEGLKLTAPPLRIQENKAGKQICEIDYRIKVLEKGRHKLEIILPLSLIHI